MKKYSAEKMGELREGRRGERDTIFRKKVKRFQKCLALNAI